MERVNPFFHQYNTPHDTVPFNDIRMEDYEEEEPGHRHISHLYGLFPSDQISVDETPYDICG